MPTYSCEVIHKMRKLFTIARQSDFLVVYYIMKFETGTQVHHRDNPSWRGVVVRDLDPRKPVNGVLLVHHNGRTARMFKDLVRVSFHTNAKKEFGEFVR